ncbi:hypothetical protein SELMODRAFT_405038 [Selaginella moellendorffii]|uniref:Pollen Ole e 1 allergen and extensin family protein n=1 Tax=Selaginella moellendorffii TaxID=88036 RepID=D8QY67_SELML|nr:uncharacterized protein LOC9643488 [Selaginella moellendorffii]XP_024535424.1 uncharacterized protein LOC9636707 [Selaginella moellendorffii]EFJ24295.1 hypothetical protein SELMODRAFT_442537 [Selaginella moellendorffii]EFJ35557.1 hypothetical protein SELMODRAFT_405038 [Selaginella moellendorffii]|eukprot:XP_002963686.1 uncharacterized protein LOC9643488 [Selaginella moellendorffii]
MAASKSRLLACLILLTLAAASLAEAASPRHRKIAHKFHRKKKHQLSSGQTPSRSATPVTRTLVGHVVWYDCWGQSLSFLPGMTAVVECKNRDGLLVFNALRTSDENGAFMVDLPSNKLLVKCFAKVATDHHHRVKQHAVSVSLEDKSDYRHRRNGGNQQLVYTIGPVVYRKPEVKHQQNGGFISRLLDQVGEGAAAGAGSAGGGATWSWLPKFLGRSTTARSSSCACSSFRSETGGIKRGCAALNRSKV